MSVKFASRLNGNTNAQVVFLNSTVICPLSTFTLSCSLDCYKMHKDKCEKHQKNGSNRQNEIESKHSSLTPPLNLVPLVPIDLGDDCSDYIPTRILERLRKQIFVPWNLIQETFIGHSEHLKELLSNPHLRSYLTNLDSSRHPAKAIERAMKEPLFVEFADECLRLINSDEKTQ